MMTSDIKTSNGKTKHKSPPDKEDLGGLAFMPYNVDNKELTKVNRKNPTKAEKKMWDEILRNKQFKGLKFLRQKPLEQYIVDFYCSKLMLVIEIDGDSHLGKYAEEYDEERTLILSQFNIKVIRYANDEVLNNPKSVCENLSKKVEERKRELKI